MPRHVYSPKEALDLILERVKEKSQDLYDRIHTAINERKEILVEDNHSFCGQRPKKPRFFREFEPYTQDEKLSIALKVLEAHFLETQLSARAAHSEFKKAAIAEQKSEEHEDEVHKAKDIADSDKRKKIYIEVENEITREKIDCPYFQLKPPEEQQIDSLKEILHQLSKLIDFQEKNDGDS